MNRKILGSVLAIMAVLALTASTFASFESAQTADTSLESGGLELSFGDSTQESITVTDIRPGYEGSRVIVVQNTESLSGVLDVAVNITADEEVDDCSVPEVDAGDTTCVDAEDGELDEQVQVSVGAALGPDTVRALDGTSATLYGNFTPGKTEGILIQYDFPDLPGDDNNLAQTDLVTFDVVFTLRQIDYAADSTVPVNGNEAGWLFNRDASTSTDYEFSTAESTLNDGSVYVPPILAGNGKDKFIAELFLGVPADELTSIAYDFFIGGNGTAADANEYYLNVYTVENTAPNEWYNCRYDYVPPTGVANGWQTVTFPQDDATPAVTARNGSVCPATPDMLTDSTIKFVSISMGDTSTDDTGLAGYFDNFVVTTDDGDGPASTTYDFGG